MYTVFMPMFVMWYALFLQDSAAWRDALFATDFQSKVCFASSCTLAVDILMYSVFYYNEDNVGTGGYCQLTIVLCCLISCCLD